ncbi:MAG: SDR family oxidoreductase [Thermoleophilaceae bacterium]
MVGEEHGEPLAERLAGKTLLLTGATGFVGKAVLSACLRAIPDLGALRLLVRAADDEGARLRLEDQILSPGCPVRRRRPRGVDRRRPPAAPRPPTSRWRASGAASRSTSPTWTW